MPDETETPPWRTSGPTHCWNHPDRETAVHCSSCGKPLCPDCMVYSPVGVKCKECARLPRSARIGMRPGHYPQATLAALGSGTILGFAYYFLIGGLGFFAFFIAFGIGWVVGEAVLRASRHYHGKETAILAVIGTVWAFVFPLVLLLLLRGYTLRAALVASFTGRSIVNWVVMLVACWAAWQRNR